MRMGSRGATLWRARRAGGPSLRRTHQKTRSFGGRPGGPGWHAGCGRGGTARRPVDEEDAMIARDRERLEVGGAEGWWDALDAELLRCLAEHGPMAPAEVGRRLGISEAAAASALSMLAEAGKVRIRLVELRA